MKKFGVSFVRIKDEELFGNPNKAFAKIEDAIKRLKEVKFKTTSPFFSLSLQRRGRQGEVKFICLINSQILKNYFFLGIAVASTKLMLLLFAYFFDAETYNQFNQIYYTASIMILFGSLGFNIAVTRVNMSPKLVSAAVVINYSTWFTYFFRLFLLLSKIFLKLLQYIFTAYSFRSPEFLFFNCCFPEDIRIMFS